MKIFIYVIGVFVCFTCCKPYYNIFYTDPVKCFELAKHKKPYDVIIVPGFPYDSGKVNSVLSHRIKWACYLFNNGYTQNIIFSGSAVYSPYVESESMRLLAIQGGVPKENIYTETRAEHTTENLYYSYKTAKQLGFQKIAFATEPAQSSFMKPFKKKFKLQLDFLPVLSDSILKFDIQFKPVDTELTRVTNFIPITQRESMLKRLSGTRGVKVKKEIRNERKNKRKINQNNT